MMMPGRFHSDFVFAWLLLVTMGLATGFAQVVVQPAQQAQPDPFDNLIVSAASFDIDSPVVAKAEFDPPVAAAGQRVIYRIEVSALDESLKVPDQLPAPTGMEFRKGGHAQTYQPTGGRKLQPRTTFLYHVTANSVGKFTMPPFEVLAYGKPVKVPASTLTVVAAGGASLRELPELLVQLPAGDIYVGQSLRVSLMLPDAGDGAVHGFNKSRITGEFIFSESSPAGMRRETIQYNGASLPAFIEELLVTPLREGQQEIIAQTYAFLTRPLPAQTNVLQTYITLVDSEPVKLNVKGLPEQGRLPGFTGAVGNYQVVPVHLATGEVRAGEPFTLTVALRGEGNLGRITPPPAPVAKDWQVFPPSSESLPPAFVQQRGFVSFSYTMIPLSDQVKATPPIPFSYFDPIKKMYVDLTIPAQPINVLPNPEPIHASNIATSESAAEKEPVLTGLAKAPGWATTNLKPLQQRRWFLALQLFPGCTLGGLWFWDSRRRYRELHPEVVLKRRARRGLRRELRLARRAAAIGDVARFATNSANALREACAPHNAANPAALVCSDVLRELPETEQQGASGEVVRRVFAAADSQRFGGPDRNGKDLLTLQPQLERLLEKLKERL